MLKNSKTNILDLKTNKTHLQLYLLGLTLLALCLRLVWLDGKSLWTDEADSVYFARHTWANLLGRLCDPHPPLYYALLKLVLWFGDDEWIVRLPSALAGALTVPLLAWLCLETLKNSPPHFPRIQIACQSALWLSVSPLHVWYSQEARMYALVALLGISAGLFAARFAHRQRWQDAVVYMALAMAAICTDWTALLPLLAANLVWGILVWPHRPKMCTVLAWIIPQILIGIAVGSWWSQTIFASRDHSRTFYQWTMLVRTAERLGPARITLFIASVTGAGILGAGGAIWAWYKRGRSADALAWVSAWTVIGLFGIATIVSAVPRLFTVKRLLVGLLPWCMPAVAWAWRYTRLPRLALIVGVPVCLVLSLINILLISKEPWREALSQLLPQIAPEDTIWIDEQAVTPFDYYSRGMQGRRVLRADGLAASLLELSNPVQGGRIWLIMRADRNRNLLDAFPSLAFQPTVWAADWPGIAIRAYDPTRLSANAWTLDMYQVKRLQQWPSALDEACR